MKLGLLGGTFNPIHRCHLSIAAQVRTTLQLDQIIFIPTGDPPHKPGHELAPASARLHMVRLAIESTPEFAVSDIEVRRPGKSYSIDTIDALQNTHGVGTTLYFIIGLDAFLDLPTWRRADEVLSRCHFVVVRRPRTSFVALESQRWLPAIPRSELNRLDATEGKLEVPVANGRSLVLLHLPPCDVSASDIRGRIRRGESVSALLPGRVESYIMGAKLYQEEADPTGG